jgi:hypothetical protein
MTHEEHRQMLECHTWVWRAHKVAMDQRKDHPKDWVEFEHTSLAIAANEWAESKGIAQRITTDDIERIEVTALGHTDYSSKLCLYVAEFIYGMKD